jgi:hypothetical protein
MVRVRDVRARPWFRATLVVGCPTCGAVPGELCVKSRRVVSQTGSVFHVARYEHARTLAGEPIRRTRTTAEPS